MYKIQRICKVNKTLLRRLSYGIWGIKEESFKEKYHYRSGSSYHTCSVNFNSRAKYRTTANIPIASGTINYSAADLNIIAITVDGKSVDTIPEGNYELTDASYCIVDGEDTQLTLNWDNETKALSVTPFTTKGTKCYLSFEEVIILDISLANIEISEGSTSDKLYISGGGLSEQIEIDNTKQITIRGATETNGITINSGSANITLNNVNINSSYGTLRLLNSSVVNLTIEGTNTLDASNGNSIVTTGTGLYVNKDAKITIDGSGILNSTGQGSGIGAPYMEPTGTIVINGGTINANSINNGAGIGGTAEASITGTIKINGGTVYAYGGGMSAGIGGGSPISFECAPPNTAPNIYISKNADVTAIAGIIDAGDFTRPAEDIGNGGFSCW